MPGKQKQGRPPGGYRFAEFVLYPSERQLYRNDEMVQLAPKSFDALVYLVSRAEHLVRKDELMNVLWPQTYVSETNLTNVVVALRKLMGQEAIRTVSKHGYRFVLPVEGEPGIKEAAYLAFVRAKELSRVPSVESMLRARDLLWLSIAEDPSFAQAWAWLGRCCRFLEKFGVEPLGNLDLAKAALRQAFALDPDLASAHHFYTPLEADLGHSQDAMLRLLKRLSKGRREPEIYAGLVEVLRFCGLLGESILAHDRTINLDPTVPTSVAHTHFLLGDYEAVLKTYGDRGNYLDAAAWAALGDKKRAIELLQRRIVNPQLSPLFRGLMRSLLAILQARANQATEELMRTPVEREPEVAFYFARHFSKLKTCDLAIKWLKRAQSDGFTSTQALLKDPWFSGVGFFRLTKFRAVFEDAEQVEKKLGEYSNNPAVHSCFAKR